MESNNIEMLRKIQNDKKKKNEDNFYFNLPIIIVCTARYFYNRCFHDE